MRDWGAFVRSKLEAEGISPLAHREAIDELAAHLADVYRASLDAGADVDAAERTAQLELANLGPLATLLERRALQAFQRPLPERRKWQGLSGDLRQAGRLLRHRPGVSVLAVLMLALGVGVSTTVFGIYDAVLLGSMPYPGADRLVLLWERARSEPDDGYIVAEPVYQDWRTRNRTLESLGIWEFQSFNVQGAADPEYVPGIRASASLFATIDVRPVLGRTFTEDEDSRGARVAVISHTIWRAQFAADPQVLGRTIRLNDTPYDVIGVMPAAFTFPGAATGIYVPMSFTNRDRDRDSHSFYVLGRTLANVTFERVNEDIARIGDELSHEYRENAEETGRATRLGEFGTSTLRRMLVALGGASALVLLIACVNVANLLIARAIDRRREFGLRRALGAGTVRLARQLLVEGLSLAGLGALGGVFIAWLGTRVLDVLLGQGFLVFWFRGPVAVSLNWATLGFAIAAAGVTAMLFSFAPLVSLRRLSLAPILSEGGRVARPALGLRRVLVAAEVALAIVVLCGAGVLVKSFVALVHVDPGLDPDRVVTLQVSLPQENTYGPAVRRTFCEDVAAAAAGAPLGNIGAISHLPLSGANASRGLSIEGRTVDPQNPVGANYRLICPGYFRTLGIPFVRGRDADSGDREPVVVINRAMADRYWKDEDPVGRRLRIGSGDTAPWMRIVGVAENVRHFGLESAPVREIFVPYRQNAWPVMTIVAKALHTGTPPSVLRDVMRRAYPGLPVTRVQTMSAVIDGSISWRVSYLRLLLLFAGLGLVLSAVGVYGVLAYFVAQRSHELGVRVALGATRPTIVRLVLRQSFIPIAAGVMAGGLASTWSGRLLNDLLFETTPRDPLVIASIGALVLLVGLLASWIPAHRAAGVDPTTILRN
jgi:putative ABC transport system permease protein